LAARNHDIVEPKNIERIGEENVLSSLKMQGWRAVIVTTDRDILANNPGGILQLFRVKTAVAPNSPSSLSDSERTAFVSKANQMNAVPYEVKVQLSEKYKAVGIQYTQL